VSWLSGDIATDVEQARAALATGQNVVVHAALGPHDPRIAEARQRIGLLAHRPAHDALLGSALATFVRAGLDAGVRRVAVAGGDTSGYVARALGVESLEFVAPLAPGSPLCRAVFDNDDRSNVEICFKGGQVGAADFFVRLVRGN
jgi:uncharacterized protein YgbK (DUF1537 family)